METPDFIASLLQPGAYPHPCTDLRLVETHISWVFLSGPFAYKIKKPVRYSFVDFSTAQLRAHFCAEELRCNRAFSPELYLDVVSINRDQSNCWRIDGPGTRVESAVKMVQFDSTQQLDLLLAANQLEPHAMRRFGHDLARQHARLAPEVDTGNGEEARVLGPIIENFATLREVAVAPEHTSLIDDLETRARTAFRRLRPRIEQRRALGFVRECHGDLHLSNLVLIDGRVRAFDCLEFNPSLRWIDTACDFAFLLMDCAVRGRDDLGYAFLDGYLGQSCDYSGAALSAYYQVYRSMVRAKVAALQLAGQPAPAEQQALRQRLTRHLHWADKRSRHAPGQLFLMCGFSGSGKSWLAERLVAELPAVRIRSDVLRKVQAGLDPDAKTVSELNAGLYSEHRTNTVYDAMLDFAQELVEAGETVIVDATFLDRQTRATFQSAAARNGVACTVIHCRAAQAKLEQRIKDREQQGRDPSEAGIAVLHSQLNRLEPFGADENWLDVDTDQPLDLQQLAARCKDYMH